MSVALQTQYNRVYDRKIDITIPTCNILGVEIAAIDMDWMMKFIDRNIKDLSGDYCCVSNVHTIITASENPEYLKVQNGGAIALQPLLLWQYG